MSPGRGGRSLGERAAASGIGGAAAGIGGAASDIGAAGSGIGGPGGSGGEGRHCWVRDPPETPGTWPGLLVEWRQRGGSWQGRVVYSVSTPHGPALVEAWLSAARLEPR